MMIDVIWPAALAPHLVDLHPQLGDQTQLIFTSLTDNNTVGGKLVAAPLFSDFGMLYCRSDLLQKYGLAVPATWDELEAAAQTIVAAERGNTPTLAGFVFQGAATEGLTCNGLEWLASSGGGRIVEEGSVTLNNDTAFDVAPLPVIGGNQPVGTAGGWQLGVSRYSKVQDASIAFVRYMTGEAASKYRAVVGPYGPVYPNVADDPDVQQSQPFLSNLSGVARVARPSRDLAANYNQGSTVIFQAFNAILNGQDASAQLAQAQSQLERLVVRR